MADRGSVAVDVGNAVETPDRAGVPTKAQPASGVTVTVRSLAVLAFAFGVLLTLTAVAGYNYGTSIHRYRLKRAALKWWAAQYTLRTPNISATGATRSRTCYCC